MLSCPTRERSGWSGQGIDCPARLLRFPKCQTGNQRGVMTDSKPRNTGRDRRQDAADNCQCSRQGLHSRGQSTFLQHQLRNIASRHRGSHKIGLDVIFKQRTVSTRTSPGYHDTTLSSSLGLVGIRRPCRTVWSRQAGWTLGCPLRGGRRRNQSGRPDRLGTGSWSSRLAH